MRNKLITAIGNHCAAYGTRLHEFYAQSFRNRMIMAASIVAGILCIIIASNTFIDACLKKSVQQTPLYKTSASRLTQPKELPRQRTIHRTLIPENPAQYGIISQSAADQPRNQVQWDIFMDKVLVKSGLLEQENAKPALEIIKKTPEEFQTRVKEINDRIAVFEQKKIENPSDEDAQKRLQTLYMLKAMIQAMENKITAPKMNLAP